MLANALPYMPRGVHLAVVDPGVGSRPARARAARRRRAACYVGPDNGLLLPAAERFGGVVEARELANRRVRAASRCRARSTAATCSRRPPRISQPASRSRSSARRSTRRRSSASTSPVPEIGHDRIRAAVLAVDRFGNVALNLSARASRPGRASCPGMRVELAARGEPLLRRRRADVRRRDARRADPLRGQLPATSRSRSPGAAPPSCSASRKAAKSCSVTRLR